MNYDQVSRALRSGVDPAMLCMTCPWDRYCITPPTMTRAEVEAKIAEAEKRDELRAADPAQAKFPAQTLITAMVLGNADTTASICPVFAMRLRMSEGRQLVDGLKAQMQAHQGGESG